jgi:NADPH:quinone reductase-like Zn-dependent oxidoreductase
MTGGIGTVAGSLAEYQVADARLLARKPRTATMTEAAALPLAVITAWEGLVDRANVTPGDNVLIHGGAGGVGYVAVQLALARGAKVFATGSGESLETIANVGATPSTTAPLRSRSTWRGTPPARDSTSFSTPSAARHSTPRSAPYAATPDTS